MPSKNYEQRSEPTAKPFLKGMLVGTLLTLSSLVAMCAKQTVIPLPNDLPSCQTQYKEIKNDLNLCMKDLGECQDFLSKLNLAPEDTEFALR